MAARPVSVLLTGYVKLYDKYSSVLSPKARENLFGNLLSVKNDLKCPDRLSWFVVCLKKCRNQASDTNMNAKTTTSEYLLFFRNTGWHTDLTSEEIQKNMARFTEWFEQLSNAGQFKGGGPLGHYGKVLAGRNVVTDGPFAESKEAIAGFFVIRADSFEHAVEIAKGCPGLEFGQTVEVRAIVPEPCELQIAREKMTEKRP
jgi:hypothetical protein